MLVIDGLELHLRIVVLLDVFRFTSCSEILREYERQIRSR
jgi:hypothetical protein